VLDLLRSLADRFPQVILITHIESVREGFDRVVRVDYDVERGAALVRDEPQGVSDGLAA
jgi:exonuclease SbcC